VARLLVLNLTASGAVLGALAVLVAVLHLAERAVGRFVSHRLGWRAVLVTGWIGVPVHELSHLAAAVIFRHRIIGWSLLDPDPTTGTLGYVRHAYQRASLWQLAGSFFIGVAPLVGGAAVLAALLAWMVPPAHLGALLGTSGVFPPVVPLDGTAGLLDLGARLGALGRGLVAEVWRGRTPWLPLQLYLSAAVAAHLAPSARDLAGGLRGFLLLLALLAASAAGAAALGWTFTGALLVIPAAALLLVLTLALQGLHLAGAAAFAAAFGRR
jgi:hypothetical protein